MQELEVKLTKATENASVLQKNLGEVTVQAEQSQQEAARKHEDEKQELHKQLSDLVRRPGDVLVCMHLHVHVCVSWGREGLPADGSLGFGFLQEQKVESSLGQCQALQAKYEEASSESKTRHEEALRVQKLLLEAEERLRMAQAENGQLLQEMVELRKQADKAKVGGGEPGLWEAQPHWGWRCGSPGVLLSHWGVPGGSAPGPSWSPPARLLLLLVALSGDRVSVASFCGRCCGSSPSSSLDPLSCWCQGDSKGGAGAASSSSAVGPVCQMSLGTDTELQASQLPAALRGWIPEQGDAQGP